MRYELPFNESLYRKQCKLRFELIWKKLAERNKKGFYYGIPIILFGAFFILKKNELGYVFLVFGAYLLITSYRFNQHYKKAKGDYENDIDEEVVSFIKTINIWEFNEEYLGYKDHKYETKIKWETFKDFKVIEDNIFLFLDAKNYHSYIISKKEVGEEAFDQLINFLNKKIKGQIPIQDRAKD